MNDNNNFNVVDNNNNNNFKIVDSSNNNKNNNDLKNSDFTIITINNEEVQQIKNIENIDNNKSLSSCEEDEKGNEIVQEDSVEESDNAEEKETVTAINNEKEEQMNDDNIDTEKDNNENNEEEKAGLAKELEELKVKIENLKEKILKLIGKEKYDYIMKISSEGVKDNNKKEEVNDKIEQFIKENTKDGNMEELFDIFQLFIFECQFYKKQENINKL